jgi:DedD protein
MARAISEQELQLKKRARRRLVGAIVLVTAVAVILPMVLDSEPKPISQNVQIHIPSPDSGEFKKAPPQGPPATPAGEASEQKAGPTAAAPADKPSGTSTPTPTAETPPAAAAPPVLAQRTDGAGIPSPTPGVRKEASNASSFAEASKPSAATEKSKAPVAAEKSKPVVTAEKARSAPTAERPKSAATAENSKSASGSDGGKTKSATQNAKAKPESAKAAEPSKRVSESTSTSGAYVVQVAALSDAAKAKQLQKQMSGAGVKTFTETVTTKSGAVTRVRAGPFATREAAERARAQLKKAGLDGHVVAK